MQSNHDNRIDNLKALMLLGICLYHAIMSAGKFISSPQIVDCRILLFWGSALSFNLSAFFMCSGYFTSYAYGDYLKLLKKRAISIFLPYLLWNAIYIAVFLLGVYICPPLKAKILQLNLASVEGVFRALIGYPTPADAPLWYMRDLMILFFIYPLIKWCVSHLRIFFIVFCIGLGVFSSYLSIPILGPLDPYVFTSFSLGVWFREEKKSLYFFSEHTVWSFAFLVPFSMFIFFNYYPQTWMPNLPFWYLAHLFAIPIWFGLVKYLAFEPNSFFCRIFTKNAFFIYAMHAVCGSVAARLLAPRIADTPYKMLILIILYLLGCAILISVTHLLLHKIAPRFLAILTGQRG